jgi:hypothetical protein
LNQFGIAGVVNQDHVNIRVKFETFDLSDPTKFVEDIVTLKVNGNGQTKTALCDFSALQIMQDTAMSGRRDYFVPEPNTQQEPMTFLVSTVIEGDLYNQQGCGDLYYRQIEIERPGGHWVPIWSERGDQTTQWAHWIWYEHTGAFGNIRVNIDEHTWFNTIQVEQKTVEPTAELKLRMVYQTDDKVLIDHLTT